MKYYVEDFLCSAKFIFLCCAISLACGMYIGLYSSKAKTYYKEIIINELCQKSNGKYDFCKLKEIIYEYKNE